MILSANAIAIVAALPAMAAELRLAVRASIEPANLDYHVDPYTSTMLIILVIAALVLAAGLVWLLSKR